MCPRDTAAFGQRAYWLAQGMMAAFAIIALTGCVAATPQIATTPGATLSGYRVLAVAMPIVPKHPDGYSFDVAETFRDDLKHALSERGYQVADSANAPPGALVVQCEFVTYEEGSAFKRWIMPGWGATQATVLTTFADQKTGAPLGSLMTSQAVGAGGLYTIGQYRLILISVAGQVATAIDNKIKGV
jgi:hypothetical protein